MPPLIFGKKNYLLMLIGLAVVALGFVLMSLDKEEYGFGAMGLTIGPIVLLIGFAIEFFAIMVKDKKETK
jgi:uncharacterized membrane protein